MKLLTKAIKAKLPKLCATDGIPFDQKEVIVKFFNPCGAATWLIVEGEEQEDGDWLMFGWADLGMGCPEWGYISLNELQSVRVPFGLGIERDLHFGMPIFGITEYANR